MSDTHASEPRDEDPMIQIYVVLERSGNLKIDYKHHPDVNEAAISILQRGVLEAALQSLPLTVVRGVRMSERG